jgi:hypothetical protein
MEEKQQENNLNITLREQVQTGGEGPFHVLQRFTFHRRGAVDEEYELLFLLAAHPVLKAGVESHLQPTISERRRSESEDDSLSWGVSTMAAWVLACGLTSIHMRGSLAFSSATSRTNCFPSSVESGCNATTIRKTITIDGLF